MTTDTQQKILDAVDAGFDAQLATTRDFVAIPSTRGAEGPCQDMIGDLLRQRGYERLNAFVALNGPDNRWELRAGVENLTDQAIRVQGFNLSEFPGVQVGFFSAPRTYDLRLILRY